MMATNIEEILATTMDWVPDGKIDCPDLFVQMMISTPDCLDLTIINIKEDSTQDYRIDKIFHLVLTHLTILPVPIIQMM